MSNLKTRKTKSRKSRNKSSNRKNRKTKMTREELKKQDKIELAGEIARKRLEKLNV